MPKSARTEGYVVSRSTKDDAYGVWQFQPEGTEILAAPQKRIAPSATYDRRRTIIYIGGYLLDWGTAQTLAAPASAPYFDFRLFPFDPTSADPLAAPPVQHGYWSKQKFWGTAADFGNPDGGRKEFQDVATLTLIPLGTFLLNFIPTAGRGTYALWNFDPAPNAPGTVDPVAGSYPFTAQGSFRDMQLGDELIALNGYVLNRRPTKGEYRLWSFDPQNRNPLAYPAVQDGSWSDIGTNHRLVAIGDYVLDWVPADRSYRLWRFDPKDPNVLTGPVRSGKLPKSLTADSTLMGFQPPVPVDVKQASVPGTIDFMRSKIKHVVYYMLENRSFDHIVGWLHEGKEKNVRVIGPEGPYDGASTSYFNMNGKKKVPVSKYNGGKLSADISLEMFDYDPYHDNSDVLRQYFFENRDGYAQRAVPDMGGFVWNNSSEQVMQTYTPEQLPVINGLARHFAISDRWFCSIASSTDANRACALTGSAMMELNNFMTPPQYIYWPQQPHRPSIFKLLWANGLTNWRIYNSTLWQQHVFTYELFLESQIPTVDANVQAGLQNYIAPVNQFYADALAGNLPAFSMIEPVWIGTGGTTSYHPGADLVPGEEQLNKIYDSLRKGPAWEQTLFVITFDEHGGIFDHVPPPYAENPWPHDVNDGFHYDLMGPRVPTIVVSPWIEDRTVFRSETSVEYDGTSFMATLLQWCGIPRARWFMGERANRAPSFEGLLTRTKPRKESPAFTPPYDKNFPPNGPRTPSKAVRNLHLEVAHQIVTSMARGKLTPAEIVKLSEEVAREATDVQTLTKKLNELEKRFS
jgi:phospholipase C